MSCLLTGHTLDKTRVQQRRTCGQGTGRGATLGGFVGTFSKALSARRGSKEQRTRDETGQVVRHRAPCRHLTGPRQSGGRGPGGLTAHTAAGRSPARRQVLGVAGDADRNRDNAVCGEPLTGHTPLARVHALLVLLGAGLPPGVRARGCVFPRSSWRFGFPTPETTSFTSSRDSNSSWAAKKLIYL